MKTLTRLARCSSIRGAHAPTRVPTGALAGRRKAFASHQNVEHANTPLCSARARNPAREGACAPPASGVVAIKNSLLILAVVAAFLFTNGCVTQRQVRTIVADSNAAMVSPYLNDAEGANSGDAWKEAVAKIDQLIAAHPEEKTLVNHLKVRQAMLLTVNRQDTLATMRWEDVDREALQTERDRALHDNRAVLVWWYSRAPNPSVLAGPEERIARMGITNLTEAIQSLNAEELRVLFGTARAQMALKLANQARTNTGEQRQQLAQQMAEDLRTYVDLFSTNEVDWVRANKDRTIQADDLGLLATLRNRVWLRKMIRDFKATATSQDVEPSWEPEWIRHY